MKMIRVLALFISFTASAFQQDAVVEITVFLNSGSVKQGTGFIFRQDASILTAYHVIEGAKKINIVVNDREGSFSDVKVEYISPEYDVAMLGSPTMNKSVSFLPVVDKVPKLSEELKLIGFPRMGNLDTYVSRVTNENFVNSKKIRDQEGAPIFKNSIDVISIDATSYVGMSGAPVLCSQGVIGLLSGSYAEGGGKAWVIPTKYFSMMKRVGKTPDQILQWEPLTLMSPRFHDLRRSLNLSLKGTGLITTFLSDVEDLSSSYAEITESSGKLKAQATVLQYILSAMPPDNPDFESCDFALRKLMDLLGTFGNANTKLGESSLALGRHVFDIVNWFVHESSISDELGRKLERGINKVNSDYAETKDGFYKTIGKSTEEDKALVLLAKEFYEASENSKPRALQVLKEFCTRIEQDMPKYCSVQAIEFASKDVGKYRAVAKLFIEVASAAP